MTHELLIVLTAAASAESVHPGHFLLLQAGGRYGFWEPIIDILQGVGLAGAGIGLVVAILIKGAAGSNSDRHALAASVAERAFGGLFLVLLGWFIYERIVEWTLM